MRILLRPFIAVVLGASTMAALILSLSEIVSVVGRAVNNDSTGEINRGAWLAVALVSFILFALQRQLVIWDLRFQLDEKKRLQKRVDKLAKHRSFAVNNIYAVTPKKDDFGDWKKKYRRWEKRVEKYLKKEYSFALAELFIDLGTIPEEDFEHLIEDEGLKEKHEHKLRMLVKQLDILEGYIREYSNLLRAHEPSIKEILVHAWKGE